MKWTTIVTHGYKCRQVPSCYRIPVSAIWKLVDRFSDVFDRCFERLDLGDGIRASGGEGGTQPVIPVALEIRQVITEGADAFLGKADGISSLDVATTRAFCTVSAGECGSLNLFASQDRYRFPVKSLRIEGAHRIPLRYQMSHPQRAFP